ncbi:unnamed protein product [Microthlaspi erraticum]|uniref:Uncharacterized protein n=1 Tax=Microthlaspi erraticum TaxID=1685480 RepID=A0A6D2I6P8_9BRAS|nr:unnamed protein product [Microthlaspi erraticum]
MVFKFPAASYAASMVNRLSCNSPHERSSKQQFTSDAVIKDCMCMEPNEAEDSGNGAASHKRISKYPR